MGKKVLVKEKIDKIISLRQHGHSLPEIRRITGHANGTVFKYIQGVKVLPEFQEFWKNRRKSSTWRRDQQQKQARKDAERIIKNLNIKERILIAVALYWAEGSKGDFSLSNTDPELIKTFIKCLEDVGISKDRISVNIRIFSDLDKEESCKFWANTIGIPREKIKYVDIRSGKKNGKLPYGMCRIRVIKGAYFMKLINEIKNLIIKKTAKPSSFNG